MVIDVDQRRPHLQLWTVIWVLINRATAEEKDANHGGRSADGPHENPFAFISLSFQNISSDVQMQSFLFVFGVFYSEGGTRAYTRAFNLPEGTK
jgi:hypothetical protein